MGYIDCAEYRASVERHFENLKRPVETAVKIAVEINPLITVYLYGSMARKIRKIMRPGVKIFQLDSDGDIMIELSKSAAEPVRRVTGLGKPCNGNIKMSPIVFWVVIGDDRYFS